MSEKEIKYQCCFCGNSIISTSTEPVHIEIKLDNDARQGLTAHKKCLIEVLHPSVPITIYEDE
jgi:hypothetical protein